MAVRPVVRYPDPVLKRSAEPVGRIDEAARSVARDLVDTMRAAPATVGLAAQQIGESIRVFVLDVGDHPKATTSYGLVVLFDPVVVESSDPEVARARGSTVRRCKYLRLKLLARAAAHPALRAALAEVLGR